MEEVSLSAKKVSFGWVRKEDEGYLGEMEDVCRPKKVGGLSVKDLSLKNLALLSK